MMIISPKLSFLFLVVASLVLMIQHDQIEATYYSYYRYSQPRTSRPSSASSYHSYTGRANNYGNGHSNTYGYQQSPAPGGATGGGGQVKAFMKWGSYWIYKVLATSSVAPVLYHSAQNGKVPSSNNQINGKGGGGQPMPPRPSPPSPQPPSSKGKGGGSYRPPQPPSSGKGQPSNKGNQYPPPSQQNGGKGKGQTQPPTSSHYGRQINFESPYQSPSLQKGMDSFPSGPPFSENNQMLRSPRKAREDTYESSYDDFEDNGGYITSQPLDRLIGDFAKAPASAK